MRSKFLLLHLSFFAIIASANAQKNIMDGYIINTARDTIQGVIDFRNPAINPGNILFKVQADSIATNFTPFQILGFGVEGKNYLTAIVDSEFSNRTDRSDNSLSTDAALDLRKDSVFLQILVAGTKSLYSYVNSMGNANFYIPDGNNYRLLEYKKYFKKTGTTRYIVENKRYAGQLNIYMNDCSDSQEAISRTDYTEQSMIQLFNRYFEKCGGGESVFHKEPEKIGGEFGILAGATFTRFNIGYAAKGVEYLYYMDNQASIDFTAAAFYEFIFPEYNGRWSINSELAFVSLSTSGEYDDIRNENIKTNYSTELEYDYITFRCMARYHYPIGKAKLFISAGVFNGFLISDNSQTTITDTTYSLVIVNTQSPFQTKSTEQGLLLGLGLGIGKWKMETRYEIGNGTSGTTAVSTNTSKVLLQTGFRF